MRLLLFSWLFLITFLANLFCSHVVLVAGQYCQSDQQSLLLKLKSSLNFNVSQSVHLVKWKQNTDCCKWSGVDCDGGGRVIGLNLSNESISGGIENSTGLFSLQYLQRLNLAFNQFNASQIPSRLANLTNLTYLNLSNAGFAGQIPIEISNLARLDSLDLSTLSLLGSGLLKLENPNLKVLVQNLTVLRELYLDGVNISANGNEWCQALSSSLLNLQVLSLSSCFLSGPIHSSLADLHSLSVIRLDLNFLSSPVPDFMSGNEGLCGPPSMTNCTDSKKSQPSASNSSNEFDWKFLIAIGSGFGIGFVATVASPMVFGKVDIWYDIVIHKILLKIRHGI
ncbi:hypothetical protein Q3G72_013971 [Acer saccharum]|nr:hypothetical protein Q3G72_013971 [Acer saccharum]